VDEAFWAKLWLRKLGIDHGTVRFQFSKSAFFERETGCSSLSGSNPLYSIHFDTTYGHKMTQDCFCTALRVRIRNESTTRPLLGENCPLRASHGWNYGLEAAVAALPARHKEMTSWLRWLQSTKSSYLWLSTLKALRNSILWSFFFVKGGHWHKGMGKWGLEEARITSQCSTVIYMGLLGRTLNCNDI